MKNILPAKINQLHSCLIILGVCFSLSSCVKDSFDLDSMASTEWNPSLAVPLVHSSMTLEDMIKYDSGFVQVDDENFITLVYNQHLLTYRSDEFISIPDQQIDRPVSLDVQDITDLTTGGSVTKNIADIFPFSVPAEEEIDSLWIKSGSIAFSVSSDIRHSGTVTVTYPTVKKSGVALSRTFTLNYGGSTPVSSSGNSDLQGYSIDLSSGSQGFSELPVNYTINLTNSGNPVNLPDGMTISQQFGEIEFEAVFGKLGQKTLDIAADTIDLDLFANTLGGNFSLVDPRINFTVTNSFGLPLRGVFNQLSAVSNTGGLTPFVCSAISPLNINSPVMSQVGQSASTIVALNNTNSNIASVINSKPSKIIYDIQGVTNYNGNTSLNFVTDESQVDIDVEVELPLYGSAFDFVIQDTLDFTFPYEIEKIKEAIFRVNVENGFPVEAKVQVYFADEYLNIIDTLIQPEQQIISTGLVGVSGKIVEPHTKITDIHLPEERIINLAGTKKLIVKATLSTSYLGTVPVKIYADYSMDVRLGMQATLKVGL